MVYACVLHVYVCGLILPVSFYEHLTCEANNLFVSSSIWLEV